MAAINGARRIAVRRRLDGRASPAYRAAGPSGLAGRTAAPAHAQRRHRERGGAARRWPQALLKQACSAAAEPGAGAPARRRSTRARARARTRGWSTALVPKCCGRGRTAAGASSSRRYMPGVRREPLLGTASTRERACSRGRGGDPPAARGDPADTCWSTRPVLHEWVDDPLRRLRPACSPFGRRGRDGDARRSCGAELRDELGAGAFATSRIHGDYCPDNLLLTADGSEVTAIVDWERSPEPPRAELDLFHLLITTRTAVEQREFGAVVAGILADPALAARPRGRSRCWPGCTTSRRTSPRASATGATAGGSTATSTRCWPASAGRTPLPPVPARSRARRCSTRTRLCARRARIAAAGRRRWILWLVSLGRHRSARDDRHRPALGHARGRSSPRWWR